MAEDPVEIPLYETVKEFTSEGGISGALKGAAIGAGGPIVFNLAAIGTCVVAGVSAATAITFSAPAIAGLAVAGALYGALKKRE